MGDRIERLIASGSSRAAHRERLIASGREHLNGELEHAEPLLAEAAAARPRSPDIDN